MMQHKSATQRESILVAAGFLLVCFGVSAIGGLATASSVGGWYQTLAKPSFNPPDWVFAPVWTALYILIAFAGWRLWRVNGFNDRIAFSVYAAQLALNLTWSILFFGLQRIGPAFVELVVLWIAIAATTVRFWKHDRISGALLVPYLAWVGFAGALNAAIWRLNA